MDDVSMRYTQNVSQVKDKILERNLNGMEWNFRLLEDNVVGQMDEVTVIFDNLIQFSIFSL